jgi:hypothetical protein
MLYMNDLWGAEDTLEDFNHNNYLILHSICIYNIISHIISNISNRSNKIRFTSSIPYIFIIYIIQIMYMMNNNIPLVILSLIIFINN